MSIPIEWIPKEPSLASYEKVFSKFPFLKTIGNSLFISITYTIITLISSSMAAFAFAKMRFPKSDLLLKVFLATMMIPTQVTIIPLFVVMNKMGLINTYPSVILPSIFRPFAVFLLTKCMRRIPSGIIEAAKVDGAGEWMIFTKMCLPLCKSAIASVCILLFIDYWNMVEQPVVFLKEQPDKLPLSVFLSQINNQEVGIAFAASALYMIPALLIFLLGEDYLVEGISRSGVK